MDDPRSEVEYPTPTSDNAELEVLATGQDGADWATPQYDEDSGFVRAYN